MKLTEAIAYFGGSRRKMAEALGITAQSTYDWGENVPQRRAYELERLTAGALKVEDAPEPLDGAA